MTREEAIRKLIIIREKFGPILTDIGETMDMAIAALREQEEQSKGCSACDGGFGDKTMVFYAGGYKHCPMCGRRLEDT